MGGIHVAVHLGLGRRAQSFIPCDVQLCPDLLALISIVDTQRDGYSDAEVRRDGGIAPEIQAEGRVSRPVGEGEAMIDPGLGDGFSRGLEVGPGFEREASKFLERLELAAIVEWTGHIELVHGCPVVQQRKELNLRRPQIYGRRFAVGLVLDTLQLQAVQIYLRDVASLPASPIHSQKLVIVNQIILRELQDSLSLE